MSYPPVLSFHEDSFNTFHVAFSQKFTVANGISQFLLQVSHRQYMRDCTVQEISVLQACAHQFSPLTKHHMYSITREKDYRRQNPVRNFFLDFSIFVYNGTTISKRANGFQDFSLNINSRSNSWRMVTDKLMDKFFFHANDQTERLWCRREFVNDPLIYHHGCGLQVRNRLKRARHEYFQQSS